METFKLSVCRAPRRAPTGGEIQIVIGSGASENVEREARRLAGMMAHGLGLTAPDPGGAPAPFGTPAQLAAGLASHKVERVHAFIEAHLAERIRVEQLAATVHMSPFHFTRMFKQATGESPHACLTRRRVERAKALLSQTGMPLVEVAASIGFQTQGHFTEVFHRRVGLTPRRFRLSASGRIAAAPRTDGEYAAPAQA
jgi:transcriptional regulator GlxA family with amidase domain